MGPVTGCNAHPATQPGGATPVFYRDARCDALMPQSRSLPHYDNIGADSPEITARDW